MREEEGYWGGEEEELEGGERRMSLPGEDGGGEEDITGSTFDSMVGRGGVVPGTGEGKEREIGRSA